MKAAQKDKLSSVAGLYNEQEEIFNTENSVIRTRILDKDQYYEGRINVSEIIFITDGAAYLDSKTLKNTLISKGMAIMLPIGSRYKLQILDQMHTIICALDENVRVAEHFGFDSIADTAEERTVNYRPIQMNDKLWHFVTTTQSYMNDGLQCENFLRMKIVEMFHILRAYYPREAITQFFHPLLTKDARFANFIYENWSGAKTLNDLAEISNLSLSGFTKKFKKVFGVAPYKWIMDKKAERIYAELRSNEKTLKQLSVEYNFCSVQHFCDYCKKKFGISPGRLRSKVQNAPLQALGQNHIL